MNAGTGAGGEAGFSFEPGSHEDVWLAKHQGRPIGAVGYALADGRWRAAWRGVLVGDSYDTREDAARALLERLHHEEDP
ncbi:MAG TPA: hypothetical protein VKV26_13875 [Dehalococcoidia bacterium]|nr:hypothetical protein [Dehalococcoidia bacterium]